MKRRHLQQGFFAACAAVLLHFAVPARAGAYEDFFTAVEVDDDGGLSRLLARGMDPNTLDPKGQHALYLALRAGSPKTFTLLLQHPAIQVDAPNAVGETPLMMAALHGRVDAMKTLIEHGAQVNRQGWTPLHYAASGPSAPAVALLLERGAGVDARAPNGNTPLMQAARYGSEDSVILLLKRGADRRLRNQRGLDAADYARLDGRDSLARRLESGGI
ncbi:MAG TPA: ankyrin repeat domain-containing protein [Rubrivivax sp.]|nr:ankyrin repeat domain-containing protein [Burkholderiales bacterium]HNT39304.1 ankyrin repeat domain-containing protein [Rubrivivax sp.]